MWRNLWFNDTIGLSYKREFKFKFFFSFVVRKKNKKQKTLGMNFILDGNEIKNLRSSPINMI
jgi:hypothetical protein